MAKNDIADSCDSHYVFFLAIKLVLDLDSPQLLVCRDQEIVSITLIIYLLYHRELI